MPGAEVSIIIPDGMSTLTKKLAEAYPYEKKPEAPDYDLLVAVDIGHLELLGEWSEKLRKSSGVKILIDHHPPQQDSPYDQALVDTTSSSAAELVYGFSKQLGVTLGPKVSQALLLAIIFDSQYLSLRGRARSGWSLSSSTRGPASKTRGRQCAHPLTTGR